LEAYMKLTTKKKRVLVVAAATAAVLAAGGSAFAFFSSTGSGNGTGSVNSTSPWVLASTPVSGLAPGLAAKPIVGSATNPAGQTEYIGTVTPVVASTSNPGCTAADFTLTPGVINADTANGASGLNFGTIVFNDRPVNQDACQGVTVNLTFTSN
jgi:hypothetical protein